MKLNSPALSISLALLIASASHALAATNTVAISGFAFDPQTISINVGDTVRWVNNDSFSHTATSDTGAWATPALLSGQSATIDFNTPGTNAYHCFFHTFMHGTVVVLAPNVPPAVSITNPLNNATFVAGIPLTIQAAASDSDGTVAQVQFFDGANSLGTVFTSPYNLTTTLYTGAHLLTAVATDNQGAAATSATVTNTGTTVVITNPIPFRIPKGDIAIELNTLVNGLASPVGMAVPDDGSGRVFIYGQEGRIWVWTGTALLPNPLLDVRNRLVTLGFYDERGLLGVALHTNFAQHPLLYTYTSEPYAGAADFPSGLGTTNNHQSVIAEWRISLSDSNVVDLASRRELLRIDEPQANHNSGAMHFGPDGFLYITVGDGGQANDNGPGHLPGGNAQSTSVILGKMIRIDVDGSNSANGRYGIPADNPFTGPNDVHEIFAYGFRNPFAFSFDQQNGQLHVADVGQNKVEEVDLVVKGGNYGWNIKEGTFWFDGLGNVVTAPVRPVPDGLIDPIAEYDHDDGSAVMGGYVYRGTAIPALQGRYVFGDWGSFTVPSGRLFYLDAANGVNELHIGNNDRSLGLWLKGFGEGPDGELYVFGSQVLGPGGTTGRMLKIVLVPPVIYNVTSAAGQISFNFQAQPGRSYTVEFRDAANAGTWTTLINVPPPAALTTILVVTETGGSQRFFRVHTP